MLTIEIVRSPFQIVEEVRLDEPYAIADVVPVDIDRRNIQSVARDIDRIHGCLRERLGQGDRNATTAGAEIQDRRYRARTQPRFEPLVDQLRDRRARNQYAPIDIQGQARKPGLIDQVCHRYALADAPLGQGLDVGNLRRINRGRIHSRHIVVRQAEVCKYKPRGLINRAIGAVTEAEVGRGKAIRHFLHQLLDRHRLRFPTHPFPYALSRRRIYHGCCRIAPSDTLNSFGQ